MWDSVASTQNKLSGGLNEPVASPQSATSLQLSLENDKLKEARTAYIGALEAGRREGADVVGYVVAINGKMSAANVYPSNALFRKMWESSWRPSSPRPSARSRRRALLHLQSPRRRRQRHRSS